MSGAAALARRLNLFDAILVVMGGVIGVGIFTNPSSVAQIAHTPSLIITVWVVGGIIALLGGFVFAELAWRRPEVGGLYAYMRDAFHPAIAFLYGWAALLISQSGGMAIAALAFARYFTPATHLVAPAWMLAVGAIALFTIVNCLGVREGGTTQNILMLLKLGIVGALVLAGSFVGVPPASAAAAPAPQHDPFFIVFGAALIPVLYAYDGWQTATFVSGELKDPGRTLSRAMVFGILAVVVLYLGVTLTGLRVLGAAGLAATSTPASDIMRLAFGAIGERVISIGVLISTLGFLSNQVLVSPRIYFAMANDGLFFRSVAWVHPVTRAPVVAILLQSGAAIVITLYTKFNDILNYVTTVDFVFFALAAAAIFIFRARLREAGSEASAALMPGHPWTTAVFAVVCGCIVVSGFLAAPKETTIVFALVASGLPIYFLWQKLKSLHRKAAT